MAAQKRQMPVGFANDALMPHDYLHKKYRCDGKQVKRWRAELGVPAKINAKAVLQFTMDGEFVNAFPSVYAACKHMSGTSGTISKCANGFLRQAYGYVWRYADAD